jgi:hypothetical protein
VFPGTVLWNKIVCEKGLPVLQIFLSAFISIQNSIGISPCMRVKKCGFILMGSTNLDRFQLIVLALMQNVC